MIWYIEKLKYQTLSADIIKGKPVNIKLDGKEVETKEEHKARIQKGIEIEHYENILINEFKIQEGK